MSDYDFSDFLNIIPDLERFKSDLKKDEVSLVKLAANEYKNDVQRLIQYDTGTLRRSVHVQQEWEGLSPVALVGTDVPYARRLEYGFYDIDSLGRHYEQPAAPVWRPVWDSNLQKYKVMLAGNFNRARWARA